MNRFLTRMTASVVIFGIAAGAQFDAASVKPNQFGNSGVEGSETDRITVSPTSVRMQNMSLRDCLRWAYGLRDSQIIGPSWMSSQRYDIMGATSVHSSLGEMRQMMQSLLTDRFRLQIRREAKPITIYEMTVRPKTSQLPSAADETVAPTMIPTGGALVFRNYSMADLAERLAARPFRLDRPVLDRTGISGRFDFSLKLADNDSNLKHTLEGMEQASGGPAPSMFTVLREQLGLNFRPVKAPFESLLIDRAERVPIGN